MAARRKSPLYYRVVHGVTSYLPVVFFYCASKYAPHTHADRDKSYHLGNSQSSGVQPQKSELGRKALTHLHEIADPKISGTPHIRDHIGGIYPRSRQRIFKSPSYKLQGASSASRIRSIVVEYRELHSLSI